MLGPLRVVMDVDEDIIAVGWQDKSLEQKQFT